MHCKWNSLTIICTLVVLVAPLLQVPSQSPSTGTCEDDTGLPWKQDDKMTRWQDDKMTTQDCPGNKACDPFALKFISYCCSYISIEWLTDSENLLPTLNHTFKSWSRDFSWWRKNYCFFVEPFHRDIATSKLSPQVACNAYFRQRSAHSRPSPYSTRASRLLGS